MTQKELIQGMAKAMAKMEGYYIPNSISQLNCNPGNLRSWRDFKNRPYPQSKGYVNFVAWARERFPQSPSADVYQLAIDEGWRTLKVQIAKIIALGVTMYEFFGGKDGVYGGYSPTADKNHPSAYAEFVAKEVGVSPNTVLKELIDA